METRIMNIEQKSGARFKDQNNSDLWNRLKEITPPAISNIHSNIFCLALCWRCMVFSRTHYMTIMSEDSSYSVLYPNSGGGFTFSLLAIQKESHELHSPTIPRNVQRIHTFSRNWFPLANRQPADQTVCSPPLQDQQQQEELVRIMGEFCVQEQQPRHDCSKGDDLLAMMDNLWPPARQQLRQCRLLPATFLQHNIERLSKLWTFVIYSSTTFCTKSWTPVLYGFVHLWTGSLLNESNCNRNRHCFSPSEPGMRMLRQMVGSVNEVASRREMNFWSDNCVYFFPESTSVKFKLLLVITGP